jgi:hypothetical protein
VPPKPPPRRRPAPAPGGAAPAPRAAAASMSDDEKADLTLQALGLRDEQLQARIVHYKAEMETSPELDAVTAQVVAQLKAMQAQAAPAVSPENPDEIEAQQSRTLVTLLSRVFARDEQSSLITQNIKTISRKLANLFFESELHEKTKGSDREKVIHHAEQGVYYVLQRYTHRLRAELGGFEYVNAEIREMTLELLAKIERDLQVGFLSRRSKELGRTMTIYTGVLLEFFQKHLPPRLEAMAKNTIRASESARQPNSVAYKVLADRFPSFRGAWERTFVEQMVNFAGDELLARLTETDEEFRDETVKFFTDPHIFSATCEVICDALYDFLCLEGFLDLPVDWRVKLGREA